MLPGKHFLRVLFLIVTFSAALPGFSNDFGDPRGFLQSETVTETPLYPGVTWFEVNGSHLSRPQIAHIVRVDVSEPHLTMKALLGERFVSESTGQFFRRSLVSQMQADNDALVAINTSFFDIGSTMAPTGLLVEDQVMIREPQGGRNAFVFTEGGWPAITNFTFQGTLRHGTSTRSLSGINRNALGNGQVNVYHSPWDRSPGTSADFTSGLLVTEVLVEKTEFIPSPDPGTPAKMRGRVLQVRENQPSVSISSNRFVITAAGSARTFLQQMSPNETVEVEWRLFGGIGGLDWNTITEGAAGSSLLVVDGQRQSQDNSHWNNRHPRSAIGISQDTSQVLLFMVEGRQDGRAEGMSLHSVGEYLQHMGAHNGLEFDGGGSSSIAARVNGENTRLNTPSGASERYVPAGLGVHVIEEADHALFENIRVSSDAQEAIISWKTTAPAISYAKFGQAILDRESANEPVAGTRHTAFLSDLSSPGSFYARLVAELPDGETEVSQIIPVPLEDQGDIIVDDPEASFTGSWSEGTFRTPWGPSYRFSFTVTGSPTHTATYRPTIQTSGRYDVFVWYTQGSNRPTDARYQIQHADGTRSISIDQTNNGERWRPLANNLRFEAGGDHFVRVINRSNQAGDALIADATRWVLTAPDPVEPGSVPAWWMTHFFGDDAPEPTVDADGDGATVYEEYLWGTNPTAADSRPRYKLGRDGDAWHFTFSPFQENRSYRLQGTTSLTDGNWQEVTTPDPVRLESGEGRVQLPSPAAAERAFYRITVE